MINTGTESYCIIVTHVYYKETGQGQVILGEEKEEWIEYWNESNIPFYYNTNTRYVIYVCLHMFTLSYYIMCVHIYNV